MQTEQIKQLITKFTNDIEGAIQKAADQKAHDAVARAIARVVGVPYKTKAERARRKGPIQLCPVPGCKEHAAPVFGMLCAEHKSVPKAKIKAYREARRKRVAAGRRA